MLGSCSERFKCVLYLGAIPFRRAKCVCTCTKTKFVVNFWHVTLSNYGIGVFCHFRVSFLACIPLDEILDIF